jgi:hypothetical protein
MINLGIYRHYKRGLYEVTGLGVDCNTHEQVVIYQSLEDHDDYPKGTVWVRPLREFEETLDVGGIEVPRFEKETP